MVAQKTNYRKLTVCGCGLFRYYGEFCCPSLPFWILNSIVRVWDMESWGSSWVTRLDPSSMRLVPLLGKKQEVVSVPGEDAERGQPRTNEAHQPAPQHQTANTQPLALWEISGGCLSPSWLTQLQELSPVGSSFSARRYPDFLAQHIAKPQPPEVT